MTLLEDRAIDTFAPTLEALRDELNRSSTTRRLALLQQLQTFINDSSGMDALYGFEHFWEVYPPRKGRKDARREAEKRWKYLSKADRKAAWRGARHMALAVASGEFDEYTVNAAVFLNQRRWEDWQQPHHAPVNAPKHIVVCA